MRPGLQSEMIRSELEDVVGEHFISTRDTDLAVYATDWSWMAQMWLDRGEELRLPDYIVHPGTVEEVSDILKIANGYRIPVIPFGGGSGTQGSALPLHGGIMLDTKRLSAIIEIDEKSLKVTTQAGIINTQLEWALNEHNLTYPHYPASGNCATMAGFLAARGTGTISTKYGKAEDMVLSMQVVLPNGDIIRTPAVPNHSSGPDFGRIFLGAEGTLGVITEATMQIDHMPETRLLRALLFDDLSKALEAGRRMMTRRLDPLVIRLYDEHSTRTRVREILGYEMEGAYMVLGFDGFEEIATAQEQRALEICADLGARDLGREPGEKWWDHRYDFYYPPKNLKLPWMYGTTETVTTFDKIEALYHAKKAAIEDNYADWDVSYIGHFSHWYHWGASLYDRFVVKEPPQDAQETIRLHNRIWSSAVKASLANGGMINDHHGVGIKLGRFTREQYGAAWPLLQSLKRTIDPNGIMNPGKLGFGY
ncbi:FAD-binding oxidoreductase [Candidatus Poribacteria bacterium]|jgi:alkyldihydroxyacetonephosphate synthase|nr:FAD-binding oxidoreductase [Candidatus Poribacteria bacterium]MBT5536105.1 FAD-binding oxidoreductase [Candidatus Poribacteria bacterium]MBT5714147.1 FAD-binding oxidoreductase [Candidatus Poribacteria bacterium]MBT7096159.1 FAD-binding oxidoreductase [Candidatus Poribacteria bacterium]MBT7806690.1 FAD-binding oxidoreductase [Candidatus Poribacteria bacterium]